jgi:hypothetical protein
MGEAVKQVLLTVVIGVLALAALMMLLLGIVKVLGLGQVD